MMEIMSKRVYLDHNATTPLYGEVVQAMLPFLEENWGNPSSVHWASREPRKAVDEAREKVAALINSQPNELVFTGSGSEGNNFAIKGLAHSPDLKGNHMLVSSVEHSSVLNTCNYLAHIGFTIDYLKVDSQGPPLTRYTTLLPLIGRLSVHSPPAMYTHVVPRAFL